MNQTLLALRLWAYDRIEAIENCPAGWGDEMSIELQYLTMLELLLFTPEDPHHLEFVQKQAQRVAVKHFGTGQSPLSNWIEDDDARLIELLQEVKSLCISPIELLAAAGGMPDGEPVVAGIQE